MQTSLLRVRTALFVCSALYGVLPSLAHASAQTSAPAAQGQDVQIQNASADIAPAAVDAAADQQGSPEVQNRTGENRAAADGAIGSDEIVVTALRSNQRLQDTPAAVTVATGELLERQQIDDVRGLQALVPATRFSASYNSTRIFIRGVGSLLDFYWIPELTASNFNGVYLPRYSINGAMYDIDNVQVLPGPQGVLYGRSAGGGAILINSRRPVSERQGAASLDVGNYDSVRAELMANLPVSDDLAVRAAAFFSRRDGFQSLGHQADDSLGVRLSALWKPSSDFSLFVWGTHYSQDGQPIATQYLPYVDPDDPFFIPDRDPITGNSNLGSFTRFRYSIAGYEAAFSPGDLNIVYRGSYLTQEERTLSKLSGGNRPVDIAQKQYTQDLSVSGQIGMLDLIGGVSYLRADSRHDVRFGPNQFGTIFPEINQEAYSVFGQATVSISDSLRVVGGARWSSDHLDMTGTGVSCFAVCSFPPISFDKTWRHTDYKGAVEFDVTPDIMLYASVQTGYAPGTLNTFTNVVTVSKEILPQRLLAYTGGVKSQLFDRALTLNVEAFSYDYKDLIIQSFDGRIGAQRLFNVPKSRVYGGQLTAVLQLWRGGSISGNVAYTHARYGTFRATPTSRDLDGLQMQFAPDWTGNVAIDHRFDLGGGAHLDARASTYFSSKYWGTFDHSGRAFQNSFTRSDASLTWFAPDDRFYVGAWIRNIEDQDVRTAISAISAPAPITAATFLEPPRTYGLKAGFSF